MDDKPASRMLDLTWADATVLSYSIGNVILLPFILMGRVSLLKFSIVAPV